MKFSHLDQNGKAKMVDITNKDVSVRKAEAEGYILMDKGTIKKIKNNTILKGDVLSVAKIAGINGAKKTADLIPLCHNILINNIDIDFSVKNDRIKITSRAICEGKTGIEMEALTAVTVCALTIYDMCKAVDKKMKILDIKLTKKTKEVLERGNA